jgi:GNAT superfamily N-acetyltransferase
LTDGWRVTRARRADRDAVLALIEAASGWMRQRGIENPWPTPFPVAIVEAGLTRREIYLVRGSDDRPIATFTLQDEDPEFWGEGNPPSIYLHRFVVDRDLAGRGLGSELLEWAAAEGQRRGAKFLRLDCLATNRRICAYYERAGFSPMGIVPVRGWPCQRFQRPIPASR